MKQSQKFDNSIHDIGFDKFFVHFWSHLQLQIYRNNYKKEQVPTISFDATGGCCQKLKRNAIKSSGSIFLYEGVMCINNQSFTVMSMLSEQHDNISISSWLRRWLRCGIEPPKIAICDQSLALMSAIVQAFTKYPSLEQYLNACFSLVILKEKIEVPTCFLRNDVNHFIHLVSQWSAVKNSRYPNTKELITRGMGLLVMCTSVNKAEKILEAIFTIILSRYDGDILQSDQSNNYYERQLTPCAKSKKYLKDLIKCSDQLENFQFEQGDSINHDSITEEYSYEEEYICSESSDNHFKGWAQAIANKVKVEIMGIEGSTDNAQFLPELEVVIIKTMKLFPIWSGIMINIFGYGTETASSSRIESNFNHIKNRVFKNENIPLRADMFLEKLLNYYRGDHLLLQGQDQNHPHFECTDEDNYTNHETFNKYKEDDRKMGKDIIGSQLRNTNTKYCEISDNDDFESEDDDHLSDDNADNYITEKETENEDEENINYDYLSTEFREHLSDLDPNEYIIREKRTNNENEANTNCQDLNVEGYNEQENEINVEFIENSKFGFLMMNENECIVSEFNEKNQQNNNKIASEIAENKALENWNRKGKNQNIKSKLTRSARSYLVHQPGFDLVDFNETRSSTMIYLMKNGNNLMNRPITVPGSGKIILNNTCTVDSLISILASSAADSIHFRNYLDEMETSNLTAKLALQLITKKNTKQIYHTRLSLLLQFFADKTETLVGGLKCLDITDTVGSMVDKLLKEMPSFKIFSKCRNNFCPVPNVQHTSAKLSINVYNGNVCVQTEVEEYMKNTKAFCIYCGNERDSVIQTTSHIIVELNSIPKSNVKIIGINKNIKNIY
uniref:NOF-FB transposable element protein n=1 Tax=Schizaphis graminum TaxID=13262 RepID=A0A2S2NH91_SCHGA